MEKNKMNHIEELKKTASEEAGKKIESEKLSKTISKTLSSGDIVHTKEFKKEEPFIDLSTGTVPDSYDETKLVLLVKDPYWLHAYWEISKKTREDVLKQFKENVIDNKGLFLRVYDMTGVEGDVTNANSFFDVEIGDNARNWYIKVPTPNREYAAQLMYKVDKESIVNFAESNTCLTPRDTVSENVDEEWMATEDEFEKIFELSGATRTESGVETVRGVSSGENVFWHQRTRTSKVDVKAKLSGETALSTSLPMKAKTTTLSSGAVIKTNMIEIPEKTTITNTHKELEVTGTGTPGTELLVGEKIIKVGIDGTFNVKIDVPKGLKELKIKAKVDDELTEEVIKIS